MVRLEPCAATRETASRYTSSRYCDLHAQPRFKIVLYCFPTHT